jgi:NAD(P)-dependent dehydrogenase (short-subunit alcohol dehydrogenase family)
MNELFDLTGKTAVVTGGTNGQLGPVWVNTLRKAGAIVYSLDLPKHNVADISSYKNDFADVCPDILVNNAGIDNPPDTKAIFFGNFADILGVNLTGAVMVTAFFLQSMLDHGGGVIVNIGSIQGYGGADWHNYDGDFEKPVGYNLSKWGLRGFSKSLTTQYGRYGIRAVTIAFGAVDTPKLKDDFQERYLSRVPVGRMITRRSLETSLLYACSCPELAGVDWRIDGGLGAWA